MREEDISSVGVGIEMESRHKMGLRTKRKRGRKTIERKTDRRSGGLKQDEREK